MKMVVSGVGNVNAVRPGFDRKRSDRLRGGHALGSARRHVKFRPVPRAGDTAVLELTVRQRLPVMSADIFNAIIPPRVPQEQGRNFINLHAQPSVNGHFVDSGNPRPRAH